MATNNASCIWKGINKFEAEKILLQTQTNGSFLIRESETIVGGFTLCLFFNNVNHQYRILRDGTGKLSVDAQHGANVCKYDSLNALVADYMTRGTKNGLVGPLLNPVKYIPSETEYKNIAEPPGQRLIENKIKKKCAVASALQSSNESLSQVIPPEDSESDDAAGGRKKELYYSKIDDQEDDSEEDILDCDIGMITAQRDALWFLNNDVVDNKNKISTSTAKMSPTEKLGYLDFVYKYFSERFKQISLADFDGKFIAILQNYVEMETRKDAECMSSMKQDSANTNVCLKFLNASLERTIEDFSKNLQDLMGKVDAFRHLFGPLTTQPLFNKKDGQLSLHDTLDNVYKCRNAILNLEKKAELKYAELGCMWTGGGINLVDTITKSASNDIPPTTFDTKVISRGLHSKVKLTVDIKAGKLFAIKPGKETVDGKNVFTHDKIDQVVLNTENLNKLELFLNNSNKLLDRRSYIFEDQLQRDYFSQLIQKLKMAYAQDSSADLAKLSIFIGTWNMGSEMVLHNLEPWFRCDGNGKKLPATLGFISNDIYVIGTQESSVSTKDWTAKLKCSLAEVYMEELFLVSSHNLWSLRLVIFAKTKHKSQITNIQQTYVKTGIANTLGNKGAVGISFNFGLTRFAFINAHLTSGSEKLKRRNQNFLDIIRGLSVGGLSESDISNEFHYLFFFGDLNYRIDDLESSAIIKEINKSSSNYSSLLDHDQLRRSQNLKEVFSGYSEEQITFPPTYRFLKGSKDKYAWQKHKSTGIKINVPSWCDRILWRAYPNMQINNTSYGSIAQITSSDHKPVFSTFDLNLITSSSFSVGGKVGEIMLSIVEIEAELKMNRSNNFVLEFSSYIMNSNVVSKPNITFGNKKDLTIPKWFVESLPKLSLIGDDPVLTQEQHIRVSVKNADLSETIGECILSLKACVSPQPLPFARTLIKYGDEIGVLRGFMHLISKDNQALEIKPRQFKPNIANVIYSDVEFAHFKELHAELYRDHLPLNFDPNSKPINPGNVDRPLKQPICPRNNPLPSNSNTPPINLDTKAEKYKFQTDILKNFDLVSFQTKENSLDEAVDTKIKEESFMPDFQTANILPLSPIEAQTSPQKKERKIAPIPIVRVSKKPVVEPRLKTHMSEESPGITQPTTASPRPLGCVNSNFLLGSVEKGGMDVAKINAKDTKVPLSIKDWMTSFNMEHYADTLLNNGWDNISFIGDILQEDLIQMGITNASDIEEILRQVKKLE